MRVLSNSIKGRGVVFLVLFICLFGSAAFGQPWDGNGVEGDPYLIYTPAQMYTIGAMLLDYDKHFRLMANIDLSAYTGTSFFIIGMYPDYPFTGVFDGNGHTISYFTYTSSGTDYIGLFAYVDGASAEIKNLGLIEPNVDAGNGSRVGSLVGEIGEGSITNCYVEGGSVSGNYRVGGLVGEGGNISDCSSNASVSGTQGAVGGLVGSNEGEGGNISNCYSTGSVSGIAGSFGLKCVGGLVGFGAGCTIRDSYSAGSVSVSGNNVWGIGGLVGSGGNIANCYSSANVSASGSNVHGTGGLVGEGRNIANCYSTGSVSGVDNVGGLTGEGGNITNCYSTGSVSGTGSVGGLVGIYGGAVSASFWDIQTSGEPNSAGGTGLTTVEMQDINTFLAVGWDFVGEYVNGPSDDWAEPNVQGYMILWWQLPEDQLPALPTFSGGTGTESDPYLISNATDLNRIGHNGRLMDKHFKVTADIDLASVDFFFIGSRGYDYSGVFNGNGHTISNFTYSSIGTNNINIGLFGGIAGEDAEVKDLGLIDPNIDAGTGDYVGLLVGWFADGTVSGCYVDGGTVSGVDYVGGLVGKNLSGAIADCRVVGSVSGRGTPYSGGVGGLAGNNGGTITNCSSSASVSGEQYVGGLVGLNEQQATVSNCHSSGIVLSTGNGAGGLVGRNEYGTITNCYSTASITGTEWVGGLVGLGYNLTNCYATGSASGERSVGGLVGVGSNLTNCYSTGSVSGLSDVGGLMGRNYSGTISASFWDIQTSGRSNMCGSQESGASGCDDGNGKTTAEMQDPNTFTSAGWDFFGESTNGTEDIWRLCSAGTNYPKLTWQFPLSDFVCPDGVDVYDLVVLCEQWLFEELSADVAPNGGDGFVNFLDWAIFAEGWQTTHDIFDLAVFADQWLGRVLLADVWPDGSDLFVDFSDWALFADAWQSTPESPNWNRRCDIAPAGGDEIVDMDDIVVFMQQWLTAGSYYHHLDADIAPAVDGDGIVNMLDFAALANNWLQ